MGVSFEVRRGRGLVVTGPTASGKSTLASLLTGLRPIEGTRAEVVVSGQPISERARPGILDLMLVPQKPYLAPGGLADQVSYPLAEASISEATGEQARLLTCLEAVGLTYLADRHRDKHWTSEPEVPWEEMLSGGEQQRLGIARCLFHRPAMAVLDECTTMVSQEAEAELYRRLLGSGVVPITVSQRLSLPEFHSQELRLGVGTLQGWELKKATCPAAG